jgi:hypothetical protein
MFEKYFLIRKNRPKRVAHSIAFPVSFCLPILFRCLTPPLNHAWLRLGIYRVLVNDKRKREKMQGC